MKKAILSCGLALSLMAACTPAEPPQAFEVPNEKPQQGTQMQRLTHHFFGPGPINYGVIYDNHRGDYLNDGHINHSPSFRTLDNERTDLGDDQEKIRSLVAREEGMSPGMVAIIGKDVWVNVHYSGAYSKDEQKEKVKRVEEKLNQALPRYDIHLNTGDTSEQE